jgi:hypothetical protein
MRLRVFNLPDFHHAPCDTDRNIRIFSGEVDPPKIQHLFPKNTVFTVFILNPLLIKLTNERRPKIGNKSTMGRI